MKDKLAKSIITLAFVVIICVVVARMLGNSETVSDYAANPILLNRKHLRIEIVRVVVD